MFEVVLGRPVFGRQFRSDPEGSEVIPKDRLGALRGRLCRGHGLSLRRRPDGRAGLLLSLHDIVVRAVGGADAHEGFASAGAPLGLHKNQLVLLELCYAVYAISSLDTGSSLIF